MFHWATLAVATVVLALLQRGQWFFGDEWDPILLRGGVGPASRSFLDPHNEHWSTLAFAVYRLHYAVFGVRTYLPLAALMVVVAVVTAHLLWRVCVRCGADPWIAAGLSVLALLYGPAHDDLLLAWNMTFVAAVGCGFGMLLGGAWRPGPFDRRDALVVWGLGVLAVASSGIGLTMVAVVGLALLVRRGWRVALAAVSVPVAVYGAWTVGWGATGQSLLSATGVRGVPGFVWTGTTGAIGDVAGATWVGIVVLVALVAYAIAVGRRWAGDRMAALACFVGAIGFDVSVALRRQSLFLPGPRTGRYLLIVFVLTVPILALALSDGVRSARRRSGAVVAGWGTAAVVAVLGVLTVVQVGWLVDDAAATRAFKQAQRLQVVATARILASGRPTVGVAVLGSSVFERSLTVGRVRRMDRAGALPEAVPDLAAVVAAKSDLLVDVRRGRPPTTPARLVGTHDVELVERGGRCWEARPVGAEPFVTFAPTDAVSGARLPDRAALHRLAVEADGARSEFRPVLTTGSRVSLVIAPSGDERILLGVLDGPMDLCGVVVAPGVGQSGAGTTNP